jgi:hypothetical protein
MPTRTTKGIGQRISAFPEELKENFSSSTSLVVAQENDAKFVGVVKRNYPGIEELLRS